MSQTKLYWFMQPISIGLGFLNDAIKQLTRGIVLRTSSNAHLTTKALDHNATRYHHVDKILRIRVFRSFPTHVAKGAIPTLEEEVGNFYRIQSKVIDVVGGLFARTIILIRARGENSGNGDSETEEFIAGVDGSHTGASGSAILIDSAADFTKAGIIIGLSKILNVIDGSEGPITAFTKTTVTATLAGGTEDDWDAGDFYDLQVVPDWSVLVDKDGNPDPLGDPIALPGDFVFVTEKHLTPPGPGQGIFKILSITGKIIQLENSVFDDFDTDSGQAWAVIRVPDEFYRAISNVLHDETLPRNVLKKATPSIILSPWLRHMKIWDEAEYIVQVNEIQAPGQNEFGAAFLGYNKITAVEDAQFGDDVEVGDMVRIKQGGVAVKVTALESSPERLTLDANYPVRPRFVLHESEAGVVKQTDRTVLEDITQDFTNLVTGRDFVRIITTENILVEVIVVDVVNPTSLDFLSNLIPTGVGDITGIKYEIVKGDVIYHWKALSNLTAGTLQKPIRYLTLNGINEENSTKGLVAFRPIFGDLSETKKVTTADLVPLFGGRVVTMGVAGSVPDGTTLDYTNFQDFADDVGAGSNGFTSTTDVEVVLTSDLVEDNVIFSYDDEASFDLGDFIIRSAGNRRFKIKKKKVADGGTANKAIFEFIGGTVGDKIDKLEIIRVTFDGQDENVGIQGLIRIDGPGTLSGGTAIPHRFKKCRFERNKNGPGIRWNWSDIVIDGKGPFEFEHCAWYKNQAVAGIHVTQTGAAANEADIIKFNFCGFFDNTGGAIFLDGTNMEAQVLNTYGLKSTSTVFRGTGTFLKTGSLSDFNVSSDTSAPGATVATNKTAYATYFRNQAIGDIHIKRRTARTDMFNIGHDTGEELLEDFDSENGENVRTDFDTGPHEKKKSVYDVYRIYFFKSEDDREIDWDINNLQDIEDISVGVSILDEIPETGVVQHFVEPRNNSKLWGVIYFNSELLIDELDPRFNFVTKRNVLTTIMDEYIPAHTTAFLDGYRHYDQLPYGVVKLGATGFTFTDLTITPVGSMIDEGNVIRVLEGFEKQTITIESPSIDLQALGIVPSGDTLDSEDHAIFDTVHWLKERVGNFVRISLKQSADNVTFDVEWQPVLNNQNILLPKLVVPSETFDFVNDSTAVTASGAGHGILAGDFIRNTTIPDTLTYEVGAVAGTAITLKQKYRGATNTTASIVHTKFPKVFERYQKFKIELFVKKNSDLIFEDFIYKRTLEFLAKFFD